MENLYGWVFTYNPYTETWLAATRDNYFDLWNGGKNVIKWKGAIQDFIAFINRTEGKPEAINELLKNGNS